MKLRILPKVRSFAICMFFFCLCCSTALESKTVTFTILSFNDVYEIMPDKDGRGGFATMLTLLNEQRSCSTHHITTVNGDFLSPSMLCTFDKGAHRIELLNKLDVDMVVLGNHEFDFGPDELKKRIEESTFCWLAANAFGVDGRPFTGSNQTRIFDVEGIKVGFFGLTTLETPELSSTEKKVYFSPLAFTARQMVQKLRSQGADVIVALTHLAIAEDMQLAKEVPEIDVILGGHDHDSITWYDDKTFIHKSGQNAYYLARVDLIIEKDSGASAAKVFPSWRAILNKGYKPDADVAQMVDGYQSAVDEMTSEILATTSVEINTLSSMVRTQEAVVGNLVADAIRLGCDADLAIIPGSIIRGNKIYAPGSVVSIKDLYAEMPFGNVNVVVELSGSDICNAIENGLSQYGDMSGRFPQVSGISFIFDESRPVGSRLIDITVQGAPLDPLRIYKVATVDFMFNGGDGYNMFKRGKVLLSPLKKMSTVGTVAEYLRSTRNVTTSIEGRIKSIFLKTTLDDAARRPGGCNLISTQQGQNPEQSSLP